ncbi:YjgF-like protein [Punctularia strigosozonata HHB-11173 SS5]|uniref:YjgF-like protein n=1 Tax=Punctularia strigosozonata (strain HHB-11173) TaxID=741275 RepID=UPI0004417F34|nr:YjgF-like protein [Punctularia strigosozonata HHB-11173 SS5]EIN07846.1 YjgF-like protein [Punctularia strigosozonata HHB-11173 SS5]
MTAPHPTYRFSTGNPYEARFGYSRAVRRGPFICVSGTTSISAESGEIQHPDNAFDQATVIFAEILRAVEALGGAKEDIIRVRMFVTRHEDTDDVGRALRLAFANSGPAATMIVGSRFIEEAMKVEIEADAIVT